MFKKLSKNLSKLFSKKNVLPLLAGIVLICLLCNMSYQGGLVEGFVEGMKEGGEGGKQKGEEQKGEEGKPAPKPVKAPGKAAECPKKQKKIIDRCNKCRDRVTKILSHKRPKWNWVISLNNEKKPCGDVCDEARKNLCKTQLVPLNRAPWLDHPAGKEEVDGPKEGFF